MTPRYRSSISKAARERVTERYPNGVKRRAEYRLERKLVGVRLFFESGEPELEYGMKGGKKHGIEYDWFDPGILCSAEPFSEGMPHGTIKQWDHNGRLIGTYRMVHGTGIDLWRQQREGGRIYLSEVMYVNKGRFCSFDWRLNEDQKSVWRERHWDDGDWHGIERKWNRVERLCRGYPKYHIRSEQVTKRQYLKAAASDPTLPPFRLQDNKPERTFPPEIAKHLQP